MFEDKGPVMHGAYAHTYIAQHNRRLRSVRMMLALDADQDLRGYSKLQFANLAHTS